MEKTVKNDFQMNQILEKFDKTLTELQGKVNSCLFMAFSIWIKTFSEIDV